jgi:hypothetical protein
MALCEFGMMADKWGGGVSLRMCDSGASFFCARGNPIESLHEPVTKVQRRSLCSDQYQILTFLRLFPQHEPVFVNGEGAQESIPPGWESIPGLPKRFTIRALDPDVHLRI